MNFKTSYDEYGNLKIYLNNKLVEIKDTNGTQYLFKGNQGEEFLIKTILPNGEKIFYEGLAGQERIVKKLNLCKIGGRDENIFHTYHFWGEPKKETFYKLELCWGGEIYYDNKGNVSSFELTPKQLQMLLEEMKFLEINCFNMTNYIYQNSISIPPHPIEFIENLKPKNATIAGDIEIEIYNDKDTIYIN
jgi:hypothetical protein